MEIVKTIKDQSETKNIRLVKGTFTPQQASGIIMSLLDQKINYHKIEAIQLWEKDHNRDQKSLNDRIKELENEKQIAKKFISEIKTQEKKIKIDGTLLLKISE